MRLLLEEGSKLAIGFRHRDYRHKKGDEPEAESSEEELAVGDAYELTAEG
jgi:hypothetical protein